MAAFEAVGHAKFSGKVGVCAATSGPGAIHLLNGLYDAKLDHVPVVAVVGQTNRSAMGGSYKTVPSSLGTPVYAPVPADDEIARAAEVVNAGKKVAVLVGQGARGARAEVERLADQLGAGWSTWSGTSAGP